MPLSTAQIDIGHGETVLNASHVICVGNYLTPAGIVHITQFFLCLLHTCILSLHIFYNKRQVSYVCITLCCLQISEGIFVSIRSPGHLLGENNAKY